MRTLDPRSLGLIVVTTGTLVPGRDHLAVASAAIEGGATGIQLRAPELSDDAALLRLARDLAERSRQADILFVVNDRIDVAAAGAGGVHLGADDEPIERAREALGPSAIVGRSVATPEEALAAEAGGADYLGVTVWETPTKPEARGGGIEGLAAIVRMTSLPVVGIGGIHTGNAAQVLGAGAAGIAVISAVAAAPDPVAATRELRAIVDRAAPRSSRPEEEP